MRGRARFKKSDLVRAMKAADAAGLSVAGIKVDPHSGEFSVVIGEPDRASTTENPWEKRVPTDAANKKRPA